MCLNCWDEEGRPYKVTDAVRQWAPRFAQTDEFGPLHIVVSDWNLEDDNINFCRKQKPSDAEMALLNALAAMTLEERWATAILAQEPDFDPESV